MLHAAHDLLLGRERVLLRPLENDLIVDLEEEPVAELGENLGALDLEHREGHDVGGAALDGRVDRGALVVRHDGARAGLDALELPVPPHESSSPASLVGASDGLLLPFAYLWTVCVPRVEHRPGLAHCDAPVF